MPYETFDPVAAGWRIQRDYEIIPIFNVIEDERESGNVKSTAISERPIRKLEGFRLRTDSRAAYEYLDSFFRRHNGPAGRFYFSWPEQVSRPDKAPALSAVAGGTQPLRTITVRFSWKNSVGTTVASPTGSLQVPASNLLRVDLPVYPAGVDQAVIYAADDDPGGEQEQVTLTDVLSWTQPDVPMLLATADPPAESSATEAPLCKLIDGTLRTKRGLGTTYEAAMAILEVYS